MFVYEKKLQYPVKIKNPNPKLAAVIISQYGGPDGELGASLRYLSQRYSMPYAELKGLLTDIGTEELGHLEMVGAIVHQLTRNLSEEDIKKAVADAEKYADEDKKNKEKVETVNNADSTAYQIEKTLKDLGDKVDPADKAKVEDAVAELRKAKDSGDVEAIKAQMEKTNQVSYEVFGKIYQQQAPQDGQPGAGATNPGPDANGNVETDYEVHDDK